MLGKSAPYRPVAIVNVIVVHNEYGTFSGEEAVVRSQCALLRGNGHQVTVFHRSSKDIAGRCFGRTRAFFSGIYSRTSRMAMRRCVTQVRPDIVHVHNVFPLISPSVLTECRKLSVPVVMTVHNYRLVCPNGLHLPKGRYEVCERCCGGREYWCVLRNCEQAYCKSAGYALRNYAARRLGFFTRNVTLFACLTQFQRQRLIAAGYPADRLWVLPNMCDFEEQVDLSAAGEFVAFVGRLSPEKGVELLLSAAANLRDIPFQVAGSYEARPDLVRKASANVSFLGRLDRPPLADFYGRSRLLVFCSTWFEGFPMTLLEAMGHAKPVIAPRIGGIPEIVDEGATGLLFRPGDPWDLAEKLRYLWDRPDLCRKMGQVGRAKVLREYSGQRYYDRLMAAYEAALGVAAREYASTTP